MKLLLVEDDPNKLKKLKEFFAELLPESLISTAATYQTGVKSAVMSRFDLIILDMTMPVFNDEFATRLLAGRDILAQLDERGIETPVIVVTQFEEFGEPGARKSLAMLNQELKTQFPRNYISSVFYNSTMTTWRDELKKLVQELGVRKS